MKNNINTEKYENYLATLTDKNKMYVNKIVENLLFFTTEEVVGYVRNALLKAKDKYPRYNLYIPPGKIGSEHYITMRLEKDLNPIRTIRGYETIDNNYPIFIIDDAIYSSFNMCGTIDNYTYNTKSKNKFIVIVGFQSSKNIDLNEFNVEIFNSFLLEHLLPGSLFSDYDAKYFYDNFGCETNKVVPIFFEHKIANEFATYQFIKNIVDVPISRKVIDDVKQCDIDLLINRLNG